MKIYQPIRREPARALYWNGDSIGELLDFPGIVSGRLDTRFENYNGRILLTDKNGDNYSIRPYEWLVEVNNERIFEVMEMDRFRLFYETEGES